MDVCDWSQPCVAPLAERSNAVIELPGWWTLRGCGMVTARDRLGWRADRVTGKEHSHALCQVARTFQVEQMAGVAKNERLHIR